MRHIRICFRSPASKTWNYWQKSHRFPEVWEYLELVRQGKIKVSLPNAGQTEVKAVRLLNGNVVLLIMGRPASSDPDHEYDVYVSEIFWPDDLN